MPLQVAPGDVQLLLGHVDADDPAGRVHKLGEHVGVASAAAAQVQVQVQHGDPLRDERDG
jgi:hypothetical protein